MSLLDRTLRLLLLGLNVDICFIYDLQASGCSSNGFAIATVAEMLISYHILNRSVFFPAVFHRRQLLFLDVPFLVAREK